MRVHFDIHVFGRVQGVFYRASARAKAQELELNGFVRNEPNGAVYAEVEGDEVNVQQFIAWCRKGPSGANVQNIDVNQSPIVGYKEFVIQR